MKNEAQTTDVTREILNQLGGNKFVMMTGAHTLVKHDDNTLSLKFKMCKKANYLKITYVAGLDLYKVEFGKISGMSYKVVQESEGVYADMLVPMFERLTGLYTKLF